MADRQIDRPFWHVKKETSIQLLTQIIKSCRWTNLLFCLQIFILSYLEINSSAAKDQKWGRDEVSHETFVCLGLCGEKALSFHFLVFDLFPAFAVNFFSLCAGVFGFLDPSERVFVSLRGKFAMAWMEEWRVREGSIFTKWHIYNEKNKM